MDEWLSNFHNFSPLDDSIFEVLSPLPPTPTPMTMHMEITTPTPTPTPLPTPTPIPMPMEMTTPPPHMEMTMEIPTPLGMPKPHEWTHEEVARYESLVQEMKMIVSGDPNMEGERMPATTNMTGTEKVVQEIGSSTSDEPKTKNKGVPWTREEHQCFLMGIHKFGRGDWSNISKNYVTSKTPIQIASHAQKYYHRQNNSTRRCRASIHDINIVNPATSATSISSFTSTSALSTIRYGAGAYVLQENPSIKPANDFNNIKLI